MIKNINVELAQALLQRLSVVKTLYPRFFEAQDKFIKPNEQLSMFQTAYIMNACYNETDNRAVFIVSAMSQWRVYKKIYNFDKDLLEMLFDKKSMDSVMKIPADTEFFKKLPFNGLCMYNSVDNEVVITTLEDTINNKKTLMFYCINYDNLIQHSSKNGMMTFEICPVTLYENNTIEEALSKDFYNVNELDKHGMHYKKLISMLAYILSSNAEISKSDKTINTYRKSNNVIIKDKFREIEELNVGVHIGNTIRLHKKKYNSASCQNHLGSSKCPHVRSGHWHSFWTGKRGSDKRTLIVKWIQPMFINADNSKNVTVNRTAL